MKKRIKISLILSLAIIFGCFSNAFAATNQNNKVKKIAEAKKSVKLLDNQTQMQPIHRYNFDNDTNNTVVDTGTMVGKDGKYDGSAVGTKLVDEGNIKLRNFNGSSDYIKFNDPIIPIGRFSIKFNIKINSNQSVGRIFSNADSSYGGYGYGIYIRNGKIGLSEFIDGASNSGCIYGIDIQSNKTLDINKWHTILITYDYTKNSNGLKIYVDDLQTPDVQGTCDYLLTKFTDNFIIGTRNLQSGEFFNGDLDDIEIYNDVLNYNIKAEELTLNKYTDSLTVGQTDTLIATVTPDNAINKTVKWRSSDPTIVSVDDNGKITAIGKGTATITATTTDGSNLSKSCVVTVNNPLILNIEPEKTKINLNDTVSANLTIDNIQDIAAEDIRIKYDSTRLQFLNYAEVDGIKLVENDVKDGELRFILASKGKANIIDAKKILLKLNFKGIAAGDAIVDVTNGRVSDGITKEWDLTDEQCGQATITIQKLSDVNNSGEYTLLDLGIDARHEGEDPGTLPQYNTDQDGNKAIDDTDLTQIGKNILENPDYAPNNIK